MDIKKDAAKLILEDQQVTLPIITDSMGDKAIDITSLRKQTGYITYDPGYANTGSAMSEICYVDGEQGILRYRGYDIEDLVEHCEFVEVAHLLIKGELPNVQERLLYSEMLNRHSLLHIDMRNFFRDYPQDSHPMSILAAMVASLSAFYPELVDADPQANLDLTVTRLLSKMRTIAAFTYRQMNGLDFVNPSYKFSYCENFLNMMFSTSVNAYVPPPLHVRALNILLILHADHEQNCSTSAVRLVGSSDANLYASVADGCCALWGTKHGGANQAVMQMLLKIHNEGLTVEQVVEMAKDKENGFRLAGFGHRIYKTYDPRAKIAKELCQKVIGNTELDPLLQIALDLEQVALSDSYFIERNLYPNVDFYTGIIFHAMGIPESMFTVLFALGRLPGWIAHWLEWADDPYQKIARPRQVYTGLAKRKVVPLADRV